MIFFNITNTEYHVSNENYRNVTAVHTTFLLYAHTSYYYLFMHEITSGLKCRVIRKANIRRKYS